MYYVVITKTFKYYFGLFAETSTFDRKPAGFSEISVIKIVLTRNPDTSNEVAPGA
jgi:hypothetical protein